MKDLDLKLNGLLSKALKNSQIFGTVVCAESGDGTFKFRSAVGNLNEDDQYFIASTTKLYTTSVIFMLRERGHLDLDDLIVNILPQEMTQGIHKYKDGDYTKQVTIRHLLAQTSGLPDYFTQKRNNSPSLENQLFAGKDKSWTIENVLHDVKEMEARFPPGTAGKAYYSDTNFQLLGKIIETITGKQLDDIFQEEIFSRLELKKTDVYRDYTDDRPACLYYKTSPLNIPKAMASFGPDGGIVSTADESMVFLKAFFQGKLFPRDYISELPPWNRIFLPMKYGLGVMYFKLPWIFSPFDPFPAFIGHSGQSGAIAYYCPEKDLFFSGTVNQVANPGLAHSLLIKLYREIVRFGGIKD